MTSAVGGHGPWREIGTPRSAGAFLPAGRGAAETHGSPLITGLGFGGKREKKKSSIRFSFCPRREASPTCGFFLLMMAYLWSQGFSFLRGNVRFQRKLVVEKGEKMKVGEGRTLPNR